MMGKEIRDPLGIESKYKSLRGLAYFNFVTIFAEKKKVSQVCYRQTKHNIFTSSGEIIGYEIHSGKIEESSEIIPVHVSQTGFDGAIIENPLIFGTFIHDIFKNVSFSRAVINYLRRKKNLKELQTPLPNIQHSYDKQYDLLAEHIQKYCPIKLGKNP